MSASNAAVAERPNALPIYLDNQSSTPLDPRVLEAMLPYFTEHFGNPHSESHVYGHNAMAAIEVARGEVARLIKADPREIVFTSGATEANNLALKGAAHFARAHPPAGGSLRDHLIVPTTEHKCVLESAAALQREGFAVTYLPVEPNGLVSLDRLAGAITDRTLLVSVMAAHNEIGVIQPLAEIGALCRARGVLFHTDAAQAFGKIPLDVEAMRIDLMSISGHKIYGPKGIGALYLRRRPRVRLLPLIDGGGQERGLRSGTLPTPLCIGLGRAAALAGAEMYVGPGGHRIDADRGLPEHRDVDWLRLYLGQRRAILCPARARLAGRSGKCLNPPRAWPLYDRRGGRFRGRRDRRRRFPGAERRRNAYIRLTDRSMPAI